jgi:isoleucyl-tRNA synthetase
MHKSKGNSILFDDAAEIVGADTMRWLYTNHAPEQNLRYPRIPSAKEVADLRAGGDPPRLSDLWMQVRAPLDKLWNVYSFFVTYANIDGFNPTRHVLPASERSDLDRWILSELQETIQRVTDSLEDYDAQHATVAIADFVDELSNWYVRRSRRRFWKSEEDSDKRAAYLTLYECLVTVTKLLAPFTPFLAESLYQNLVRSLEKRASESVHLCDWPAADTALLAPVLRDETALVMRLVNLGRAAREKASIRVRQPVSALYARVNTGGERAALERLADQMLEELNVKRLELLPEHSDMLLYTLRPRMAVLGPKHGKLAQKVLAALRAYDPQVGAQALREEGRLILTVEGQPVELLPEEVEIEASAREGFVAAEERGYVVVLETTLTPELQAEGLARDLTHLIQDVRKHASLAIEDTIETWVWTDSALAEMVERFAGYLKDETLSAALTVSTDVATPGNDAYLETIPAAKLGGHEATIAIRKRA